MAIPEAEASSPAPASYHFSKLIQQPLSFTFQKLFQLPSFTVLISSICDSAQSFKLHPFSSVL
jgi:hypothetical protein